jgi:hypothetical protein
MKLRNLLIAVAGLAVTAGAAGAASADTPWQAHHPRREEVNQRLGNLNGSIHHERHEGEISAWQARRMHFHVHQIRRQERFYARHDGGHISRWEQARLNHEENGVRHHIPG